MFEVNAGAPQGTKLGPILFFIVMIDLAVKSLLILFIYFLFYNSLQLILTGNYYRLQKGKSEIKRKRKTKSTKIL